MLRFILFFLMVVLIRQTGIAQTPDRLGKATDPSLQEISGIIPSSTHPHHFWVHNDSGDGAHIYLIDSLASLVHKVILQGITCIDVEDIAWLNIRGEAYILLGDIGNNSRSRDTLSFYLFKEPKLDASKAIQTIAKHEIHEIKIKYMDKNRDAEAFFVDPQNNEVYLVSKRDFKSQVFSFPIMDVKSDFHELMPKLELPFNFVTAADISRDGKCILIKNMIHVFRWDRRANESILTVLTRTPIKVPYLVEPQGEALCFDIFKTYFYTISERPFGLDAVLFRYILQ